MNSYPVDSILPQLKEAVLGNPSVVLTAPPGAGKTTRVPLALLGLVPPDKGRILVLEPRRIAAVSAARWMAHTLGEQAGETVGYSIRFESRVSASTRVEVVTEGILTRRIQADPGLDGVAMVIFDEFHERSLNADLGLALCLDLRRGLREDLKILIMSATLDCGPISSLLDSAPVITSGGKAFPVEERYIPDRQDRPLRDRIAAAVRTALAETSGDILIFLPGSREIRVCAEALIPMVDGRGDGISLHPLYGDLPFEEQERAILPSKKRKIVLATNIAETSLTIEGVGVVIDSGLTRRLRHDPSTGMNRLITVSVSKASAEQRKGRAGRLGPGVCYRLYSRHAFQSLVPFTPPEMLLSDLSGLALELAVWGVKDPSSLSWLDAPPLIAWDAAGRLLTELGALDPSGSVTVRGRAMARLPLHPRLGRLLLRAEELHCLHLGADLAALLTERDILRRAPSDSRTSTDGLDISRRLDMLRHWRKGEETRGRPLDPWAMRSVERTSKQLMRLMGDAGKRPAGEMADADEGSRLLLSAFPDRIAQRRDDSEGRFVLARGRGVRLPPHSLLSRSPFIIAVDADAGKEEGMVHLAAGVDEAMIRGECADRIEKVRRLEWDRRKNRVVATLEERLGSVALSMRPFDPNDEEAAPLLCEAIRSAPSAMLTFATEVRQLQGRVALMRRVFPEEGWPDLSEESLLSTPEEWLLPYLSGLRSAEDLARLNILPVLRAHLSRQQGHLLDERAPASLVVPSGHRVPLDYSAGDVPVLAVKLQEMFGLADTPVIAHGRVRVLVHLLSPSRRPVQITQDLRGFWNSGYQQVKKELRGRYPKHPWPEDPWNAVPTRRTRPRGR